MAKLRIKELREQAGVPQRYLAQHLDVSRMSISRWERGEAIPAADNLPKLAQLFGVTIEELFAKEG